MDNEVSTSSRDHPRIDDPEVIYIIHITLFLTNNIQYSIFTNTPPLSIITKGVIDDVNGKFILYILHMRTK